MAQSFRETPRPPTKEYDEGHERIFGKEKSQFCEKCDKRHSWCECDKKEEEKCKESK